MLHFIHQLASNRLGEMCHRQPAAVKPKRHAISLFSHSPSLPLVELVITSLKEAFYSVKRPPRKYNNIIPC